MAVIKLGQIASDIRGSVGGITFSRNKSGAYARARTKGINSSTDRQAQWRSIFGNVMNVYSSLDVDDKIDWNASAETFTWFNKLGDPFVPSGQQLFMKLGAQLQSVGVAIPGPLPDGNIDTAPSVLTAIGMAESNAGVIAIIRVQSMTFSTNTEYIVIEATPPRSSQQISNRTPFKQVFGGAEAATQNLLATYSAVFGAAVPIGSFVTFRIKAIDLNGIAGPWFYTTTEVDPPS